MYVNENIRKIIRIPQPEDRGNYLRLDQNENIDGVPQWLFEAVIDKITPKFLSIYPEETRLTKKYADLLNVSPDMVSLTDGSVVGMGYIIKVFGEPTKTLLTVTPTFGMYKVYAEMVGMDVKQIEYEDDYKVDVKKILENIDSNTGIVVLVNPNMPMGDVYSIDDIERIVEKAYQNGSYVIIDEAYHYFYRGSSINLLKKYNNVFVLRTFSKMLSIPALRLGSIISSKENIHYIENYKPHYTVNAIALLFGEAIVDNHDRLVSELTEAFVKGRQVLVDALKNNNYHYILGEGCFVCIKPKYKTVSELTESLRNNNILVLAGSGKLSSYIRVTITSEKYMNQFITALITLDV